MVLEKRPNRIAAPLAVRPKRFIGLFLTIVANFSGGLVRSDLHARRNITNVDA